MTAAAKRKVESLRGAPNGLGHALPALLLVVGATVLVLMTQRAIAGAAAHFVAGIWVSAMELVFGLIGALFGGR